MNVRSMKQWSSLVKEALDGTFLVTKFLCLLQVTNTYLCTVVVTYGPSMFPTLSLSGDLVLAERITPRLGKVGLGDVVLVRPPENPRKVVTKRVVGVEGDRVTYFVDPKNSDRCQTILGGSYIHARGFSIHHVYKQITEHAAMALHHFLGINGERALNSLLTWICSYQTLFSKVCSKCGRLAIDRKSSLLLPPVCRPHRYFSPVKVSSTQPISSTIKVWTA